jgi:ACS family hexuronate transporter-like MFS transporter
MADVPVLIRPHEPRVEVIEILFQEREVWLLMLVRLVTDPVWYFYLFWFPKYLSDTRHLMLRQLGSVAWVVYLAADLGSVSGGCIYRGGFRAAGGRFSRNRR